MANCNDYISADDLKTGKQAIQHIEHVAKSKDANGADALMVTDTIGTETVTDRTLKGIKADGDAVVEETRQNLIPLSRQYMTLADAQADIANIPEGSTTYYRSPDDSALAIEVMNVGGTLQPTGRKMPSQSSVSDVNDRLNEEIKQRKHLIDSNVQPGVLSILDDNGYEAGKITDSSFEVEKLKMKRLATGPVVSFDDPNGYSYDLISQDGSLMVGRNKLKETLELISFLDPNGYVIKLLDVFGRIFVGRNILFDIKGYTVCFLDPNGWVIWGITEDGYTISREGSVEPTPSVLENDSVGHWLFGYENTSYKSRTSDRVLTPQSKPSFNTNYILTLPWNGALISDIPDAAEYTVCAVVRVPNQASLTDNVVIYGTQNGYALRDDDNTYKGNQLSIFSDRDDRRWLRSKISDYRGTSRNWLSSPPPVGEWVFITHVVRLTGTGKRYQVIRIGNGPWQELREPDSDRISLSGRNIAVGNGYCDVAAFKTKGLEIAEFIYFDRALMENEVTNVYNNSKIRMTERSINLN